MLPSLNIPCVHSLPSANQMHHMTPAQLSGPAKQSGSPSRHGHSPSARLQAARSFFTSSRTAGCKAGHPQAVLQGLVQALHQLPADLNQGQHNTTNHWSLPAAASVLTIPTRSKVCHHNLSMGNSLGMLQLSSWLVTTVIDHDSMCCTMCWCLHFRRHAYAATRVNLLEANTLVSI